MIIKVRILSIRRDIIYSCDKGLLIFIGRQMFIFMQVLMLKMGRRVTVKVKIQFISMILVVWRSCILYFSCIVWVMVCYFFRVMVVRVQIESLLVKIVKKLVVLQFVLVCQLMVQLWYWFLVWILIDVMSNRQILMQRSVKVRLYIRNRGIVSLYWLVIRIISIMMFLVMVRMLINYIKILRILYFMIFLYGLNVFGLGE